MTTVQQIFDCLSSRRLSLANEKRTQEDIAGAFDECGIPYEREYRLDGRNIIDFKVHSVGIEIKVKGHSKLQIYRQMERYSEFGEIKELMLVTNIPTGFPKELNGKPVYVLNLAKAWL